MNTSEQMNTMQMQMISKFSHDDIYRLAIIWCGMSAREGFDKFKDTVEYLRGLLSKERKQHVYTVNTFKRETDGTLTPDLNGQIFTYKGPVKRKKLDEQGQVIRNEQGRIVYEEIIEDIQYTIQMSFDNYMELYYDALDKKRKSIDQIVTVEYRYYYFLFEELNQLLKDKEPTRIEGDL